MSTREELEEALRNWADILISNSEEQIRIRSVRTFLSFSYPADRYSNWVMVGVAGALLAILSNLNGVADLIGYPCLKAVLFLLVLSLVFGVLQRVVAYPVQLSLQAEIDGEGHVMAVAKAHEEDEQKIRDMAERNGIEVDASINVLRAITSYYSLMPQPYRWWLGRQIQKIITDNDYMRRKLIRGVIRQSLYTFGQLALALAALMLVMLNI